MIHSILICVTLILGLLRLDRPFLGPTDPKLEEIVSESVESADWSPDGQYLAYTTWHVVNPELTSLNVIRLSDSSVVFQTAGSNYDMVRWSPDGTKIAVSGDALTVIDWQTRQNLFSLPVDSDFFHGDPLRIADVDWNSTSDALAAITGRGEVVLVAVPEGNIIQRNRIGFGGIFAHLLDWSPDDRLLAAQGNKAGGNISIWEVASNAGSAPEIQSALPLIERIPAGDDVYDIEWNGTSTALALADAGLRIFSINDLGYRLIHGYEEVTSAVAWSPDGTLLVDSSSYDGQTFHLNFWDAEDFEPVDPSMMESDLGMIFELRWAPDSTQLAIVATSGLWIYRVTPG